MSLNEVADISAAHAIVVFAAFGDRNDPRWDIIDVFFRVVLTTTHRIKTELSFLGSHYLIVGLDDFLTVKILTSGATHRNNINLISAVTEIFEFFLLESNRVKDS